jgi:extradiol dioxygenase family protein
MHGGTIKRRMDRFRFLRSSDRRAFKPERSRTKISFEIEPEIRFEGLPGEQATFFILDPSGNALEFKAFEDESRIFAR